MAGTRPRRVSDCDEGGGKPAQGAQDLGLGGGQRAHHGVLWEEIPAENRGGFHQALRGTDVEKIVVGDKSPHPTALGELVDGVGELDLTAMTGGEIGQDLEDLMREEIAPDQTQVGRSSIRSRFLDRPDDVHDPVLLLPTGDDDPVMGQHVGRQPAKTYRRAPGGSRLQRWQDVVTGTDDVVGQQAEKAPIPDRLGSLQNRMAEAERLFLHHHPDLDVLEARQSSLHQEVLLDQMAGVEIDDDEDLLRPGPGGLFDHVLDGWAIDDGQESLGYDPGGGAHAGPSAGGRNHSY